MIGVALLKIPVTDLVRSVPFYERLGLKPVFVSEEYGWAQLEGAALPMALYVAGKGGGDGAPGSDAWFHLTSDDLDGLARAFPDAPLVTNDDGSRSLDLSDPDGNTIRVFDAASGD